MVDDADELDALWERLCLDAGLAEWVGDPARRFEGETWTTLDVRKTSQSAPYLLMLTNGQALPRPASRAACEMVIRHADRIRRAEILARDGFGERLVTWRIDCRAPRLRIGNPDCVRRLAEEQNVGVALLAEDAIVLVLCGVCVTTPRTIDLPAGEPRQLLVIKDGIGDAGTHPITVCGPLSDRTEARCIDTDFGAVSLWRDDDGWRLTK